MDQLIRQLLLAKRAEVELVEPDACVADAVARMNARRVGSLLVIDHGRLVGILTERDLLVRVLAARHDPDTTRVREVMTRDLVIIAPEHTVALAMIVATRYRCRHLPVVDQQGKICGLVSAGDLMAWVAREQQHTIHELHAYITGRLMLSSAHTINTSVGGSSRSSHLDDDLAYLIHDLKSPVNAIELLAQSMLRRPYEEERSRAIAARIRDEVHVLSMMIMGLLDINEADHRRLVPVRARNRRIEIVLQPNPSNFSPIDDLVAPKRPVTSPTR